MGDFLEVKDKLSSDINKKAIELYELMENIPVDTLNMPEEPRQYYKELHNQRRFFSVQSAAELLYRSIKKTGKPPEKLTIMDYGGGMGTIFLLGKMIGCRRFIYSDIREDMTRAAEVISTYLNIPVDYFLTGTHRQTCDKLNGLQLNCDIILSRNVIEHVYDLSDFYHYIRASQPDAILFFSTTANYHNPAMLWYHKKIHKRFEKIYLERRKEIIRELSPGLTTTENLKLAGATRGLAMEDLETAILEHKRSGTYPDPDIHYTNTCDPDQGLWQEHIIPYRDYERLANTSGYRLEILPSFWDTHYQSSLKNLFAKGLNLILENTGKRLALRLSPFIYIVTEPK